MENLTDEMENSLALAKLISREYSNNEEIQSLMQQITDVEKEVAELEAREKSLRERKAALHLQSVTLDMIDELRQPDREQEEKSLRSASECYEAFLRLVQQLQSFDLSKIGKYDHMMSQMEMEKELKGMVDYYNETKAVAEAMEQRAIVQQLRKEQATLAAVMREYDEEVKAMEVETRREKKLLEAEQRKTNEFILKLVKNAKIIQDLEAQLNGQQTSVPEKMSTDEEMPGIKDPSVMSYERYLSNTKNPFHSFGENRGQRSFPKLLTFSPGSEGGQRDKSNQQPNQFLADSNNKSFEFNRDQHFLADVTKNLSLDGRSSNVTSKTQSENYNKSFEFNKNQNFLADVTKNLSLEGRSSNVTSKGQPDNYNKSFEFNKDQNFLADVTKNLSLDGRSSKGNSKEESPRSDKSGGQASKKPLERMSEMVSGKTLEKVLDKASEKTLEKVSDKALEKSFQKISEKALEKSFEKVSEKTLEKTLEKTPGSTSEKMSEQSLERTSELTLQTVLRKTWENNCKWSPRKTPERTLESNAKKTAENTPEKMSEKTPEKMPEKTPEKTPEQMLKKSPQTPAYMDESPKSTGGVKILNCRVVKPAGSALPQAFPLSFSPNMMKSIETPVASPSTSKDVTSAKERYANEQGATSPREKYLTEQPSTSHQLKKKKVKVQFNLDEVEKMLMETDPSADDKLSELEFGSPGKYNMMSNFDSPGQGFNAEENFTLDFGDLTENTEFNSDFL